MKRQLVFNTYQFVQNASGDVVDIYIDGDIVDEPTREMYQAFWGDECSVSFKSIRNQFTSSKAKTFNIYINSGGGMVSDAFAIHDYIVELQNKGTTVNCVGMGIIASAATYILMASNNSRITENSWFMIHNMSGGIWGDVNEIENYARMMRRFNDAAVNLYATTTGKDTATITAWMNEETWFIGEDAAREGFVKDCSGKENGIKNAIPKDKWPFNNTAILNTINNSISKPKNKDMKLKKIGEAISNAVQTALKEAGLIVDNKVGTINLVDFQTSITNAVNTSLESLETDISEGITNGMTEAMKGDAFNTAVANAVKKALETVPENITNAITAATKDVATKTELQNVVTDLSDKLGTPGVRNSKKGKKAAEPNDDDDDEEEVTNITSDATNGRRIVEFE